MFYRNSSMMFYLKIFKRKSSTNSRNSFIKFFKDPLVIFTIDPEVLHFFIFEIFRLVYFWIQKLFQKLHQHVIFFRNISLKFLQEFVQIFLTISFIDFLVNFSRDIIGNTHSQIVAVSLVDDSSIPVQIGKCSRLHHCSCLTIYKFMQWQESPSIGNCESAQRTPNKLKIRQAKFRGKLSATMMKKKNKKMKKKKMKKKKSAGSAWISKEIISRKFLGST